MNQRESYLRAIFHLQINQEPQQNDWTRVVQYVLAGLIIVWLVAGLYAVHVGLP